jgi:hypothetical protein
MPAWPSSIQSSRDPRWKTLLAVQIVATGFSGLRFPRQGQSHMTKDFIDVYGGFAIKLLRLQTDLIQALDRHRRGNSQTKARKGGVDVRPHPMIRPPGLDLTGAAWMGRAR